MSREGLRGWFSQKTEIGYQHEWVECLEGGGEGERGKRKREGQWEAEQDEGREAGREERKGGRNGEGGRRQNRT